MKIDDIQKEIIDSLPSNPHGRILVSPRVGKTKLIIDIIKRDKPKSILWVTPSAKLAEQDIPDEFSLWKAKKYLAMLRTVTWMSLHKVVGHYDMVILDEEHAITENNCVNLLNKTITYKNIISMTGTATKHNNKNELYKSLNLKVLSNLSINQAVNIGILANYEIKVLKVAMSEKKDIVAGSKQNPFMTSETHQYNYLTGLIQHAKMYSNHKEIKFRTFDRMRFIKNSPSKLKAAKLLLSKLKGKILIFSGTIKQAEALCKHRYHSKTDNTDLQLFQDNKIDRISMVNAGGTGFSYTNIDHLVLVQADSNRNGNVTQKIGRTLLKQKDYKATIWMLSLSYTKDSEWVKSALEDFDENKISYIKMKENGNK